MSGNQEMPAGSRDRIIGAAAGSSVLETPDRIGTFLGGIAAFLSERSRWGVARNLLIVIAFTLAVTLPFINLPFHMDDTGFIDLARVRQNDPLQMELKDYVFFGQRNEKFLDTHPPLISSYLAIVMWMDGGRESEAVLHLAFLVFPLLAAVSMYFLSRKFTRHALAATLLMAGTAGFITMSHTLMSDLPGLSFWLAAAALYIYGMDRRSLLLMSLCGIVLSLGVFTSYQILSIIPLMLVYAALRGEFGAFALIPVVLPLSSFACYMGWHLIDTGMLPRFSYGEGEPMAWYSIVQKAASMFATLAGAGVFFGVLFKVLVWTRREMNRLMLLLAPVFMSNAIMVLTGRYTLWTALLLSLLMPLGMFLVLRIYETGWRDVKVDGLSWRSIFQDRHNLAGNAFLLLWLTGILFYVAVIMPYSSVRYLLPVLPPLVLMFVRLVESQTARNLTQARKILAAGVVSTAVLGLLVSIADLNLASANREVAQNEAASYGQQAKNEGHNLWFSGEFGLRYYMEQQGYQELPKDISLSDGDLIIQSPLANWRSFSQDLDGRLELIDMIPYRSTLPIKVINHRDQAGFYGSFWGILPFSISTDNVEDYLVYRVVPRKESQDGA